LSNFAKILVLKNLEILDFIDSEIESFVTFKATLFQNKKDISFIEKSRFLKESNIWLYVDGEFLNS
jgi:SEC-C motif-containing protein